jgi:hypothetical protein
LRDRQIIRQRHRRDSAGRNKFYARVTKWANERLQRIYAAENFSRKKFQVFPAKFERPHDFRWRDDAGKQRQFIFVGGLGNRFAQPGRNAKLRAGIHGLFHLISRQ